MFLGYWLTLMKIAPTIHYLFSLDTGLRQYDGMGSVLVSNASQVPLAQYQPGESVDENQADCRVVTAMLKLPRKE